MRSSIRGSFHASRNSHFWSGWSINYFFVILFLAAQLNGEENINKEITQAPEEFETLFEIVDLDENVELPKTEVPNPTIITNNILAPAAEAPAVQVKNTPPKAVVKAIPAKEKSLKETASFKINFSQVFSKSPIIYTVLLVMSVLSFFIWLIAKFTSATWEHS